MWLGGVTPGIFCDNACFSFFPFPLSNLSYFLKSSAKVSVSRWCESLKLNGILHALSRASGTVLFHYCFVFNGVIWHLCLAGVKSSKAGHVFLVNKKQQKRHGPRQSRTPRQLCYRNTDSCWGLKVHQATGRRAVFNRVLHLTLYCI